jgi:hypothetical protein
MSFQVTAGLVYTPPGAQANSGSWSFSINPTNLPQCTDTLEVPATTAGSTAYNVPFGSITQAKAIIVFNRSTGQDIAVKINGFADAIFSITPGGTFMFANPTTPGENYITSVVLVTTAVQGSSPGLIDTFVLGDQ